jgi:hypothetical protein
MRGRLAVAIVVVGAATMAVTDAEPASAASRATKQCNGDAALCARRFDEVTLAGTHNAMANPAAGFVGPEQQWSIREQLDAGIRALLLDVYQGTPNGRAVCTDPTPLKVGQVTRELGEQAAAQLIAIRNATCPPADGPTSTLYLCHSLCEAGATPLADQLGVIRAFLEEHPGAVVALVLEDYVDAADIEQAFAQARLTRYALARRPGTRWPTLEKMVASGKRLVVFSEHQGGTPRWLLPAFDEIQDTPFTFHTVDEFSCEANRGPEDARILLVNHWLSTPSAGDAATATPPPGPETVNSRAQLAARVEQCRTARGKVPNIVAVDHAETGDLLSFVDELNTRAH